MEVTVNTNNTTNENAKLTIDEHALTSLIKDLVGSDFARALSAVKNIATPITTVPVPPTQPITPAEVPAAIRAKAEEEEAKEEVKECPTVKKDGVDMEELKKNIIMMELAKLNIQFGDSNAHKIVEMVERYIGDYNMTKLIVNLTKLCYTEKEMYKSVIRMLEPMKKIGYDKFDEIYTIVSDVNFYC